MASQAACRSPFNDLANQIGDQASGDSVDAPLTHDNLVLIEGWRELSKTEGGWLLHRRGTPMGFLNKCGERRLEWLASPQARSTRPQPLLLALPSHP